MWYLVHRRNSGSLLHAKRLTWALFVSLLSTLVCFLPTELIWAFLFHKFSNFIPPPPLSDLVLALVASVCYCVFFCFLVSYRLFGS